MKKIAKKNMYSNFDYFKIDPQYYLFSKCVRLLDIKKIIEGVKYRA